jgi:hypothetical protein
MIELLFYIPEDSESVGVAGSDPREARVWERNRLAEELREWADRLDGLERA